MTHLTASKLREGLADALNRVAYGGERIMLQRRGKDVAALVSKEDLDLLEALEERSDILAALKALQEPGSTPWKRMKTMEASKMNFTQDKWYQFKFPSEPVA